MFHIKENGHHFLCGKKQVKNDVFISAKGAVQARLSEFCCPECKSKFYEQLEKLAKVSVNYDQEYSNT